jgi:DNA repair protein RadA/Sms
MIFHCKHCKKESRGKELSRDCPHCKAFKPWVEGRAPSQGQVLTLSDVRESDVPKISISPELDEALDGGVTPGGVYLMGGEPGIGKSTLTLQTLGKLSLEQKVMYVSAEEAGEHIKGRASRINVQSTRIRILESTDGVRIERALDEEKPDWCVLDSISAIQVEDLAIGSIQGQKEYINRLYQRAHRYCMGLFVICHFNKEGDIAGPKALEHAVDTVTSFEGERRDTLRVLRTLKNRFGQTPRMGLFEMSTTGLKDVENAGAALFRGRAEGPGSVLGAAWVDGRCLLVEIQTLFGPPGMEKPRTVVSGLNSSRVALVRAILERFSGSIGAGRDMYVNVVGGMKIDDTCLDLPLAMSMYSACKDVAVPKSSIYCGETGLLGEILPGPKWEDRKRIATRAELNMHTFNTITEALEMLQ